MYLLDFFFIITTMKQILKKTKKHQTSLKKIESVQLTHVNAGREFQLGNHLETCALKSIENGLNIRFFK